MWIVFLIFELISISICFAMKIGDLFYKIIPGEEREVRDKIDSLSFAAFAGGWFLAWYFIYLAIKAIGTKAK
jgi:hypothetical protein